MDFIDQVKQFSNRVASLKDAICNEEATKTSIIMPFFAMLGYDVFNPQEFVPEFTADVGIKKREKVDYAIIKDGEPVILIEAKSINENLERHDSQLFRYFCTTKAKFAILTNGIIYRFYTDLEEPNKMDTMPFLEIDILNIRESHVAELKKFCKNAFSVDEIFDAASVLKYANKFKTLFASMIENPSDDFVRYFLQDVYFGVKTQAVVDKFRPILRSALNEYISETMNDKIKTALGSSNDTIVSAPVTVPVAPVVQGPEELMPEKSKIMTTEEELEAFFIIRSLLKDLVPFEDIVYKDTVNYFGILYKGNRNKWICRLILKENWKQLWLPDGNGGGENVRYQLSTVYDLEKYQEQLIAIVKKFMG